MKKKLLKLHEKSKRTKITPSYHSKDKLITNILQFSTRAKLKTIAILSIYPLNKAVSL